LGRLCASYHLRGSRNNIRDGKDSRGRQITAPSIWTAEIYDALGQQASCIYRGIRRWHETGQNARGRAKHNAPPFRHGGMPPNKAWRKAVTLLFALAAPPCRYRHFRLFLAKRGIPSPASVPTSVSGFAGLLPARSAITFSAASGLVSRAYRAEPRRTLNGLLPAAATISPAYINTRLCRTAIISAAFR